MIRSFRLLWGCLWVLPLLQASGDVAPTGSVKVPFHRVYMNMDSGSITIEVTAQPFWKYDIQGDKENCHIASYQSNRGWIIESKTRENKEPQSCRVHWVVGIPLRLAAMTLNVGQARITMNPLRINKFQCNGGDVDVTIKDFQGFSQWNLGSGKMHMSWSKRPHPQQVVEINAGQAQLLVTAPNDTSCDVSQMTHPPFMVTKKQSLTHNDNADITIKGSLGSGDIKTVVAG